MSYMTKAKAKAINCGFLLKSKPHFFLSYFLRHSEKPTSVLWSVSYPVGFEHPFLLTLMCLSLYELVFNALNTTIFFAPPRMTH